ncbi:MAG TPA: ABC transporter substrate-binding protein, partial [Longimicrobiales bacterium]
MRNTTLLCVLVVLAGCRERPPAATRTQAADTGGTAVVAMAGNLDYANGLLSGERNSQDIIRNALFLPLLRYDEHLQLAPLLATSWAMSGDTAVVLKLRNDVHWHDGVKTSAYDVEFTYRYGKDPRTGYPNGDYWVGWNQAQVIDSFTIRFSIAPQPDALANLPWIPIMPRHLLEKIKPEDLKKADFNLKPVGNGPFRFVEYRPNDRWVFEANRDFPAGLGGRPRLDRVVFRIIPDETAQEAELISGSVDLTPVRPDRAAALAGRPGLRSINKPGRQFAFIGWNTRRPPLDDARVRRALTMAIDRERILKVVRAGLGEVAAGPVPGFHWSSDPTVKPLPFSPDSARALLSAAGLEDRNADGKLDLPSGKTFRIELKVPSNNRQNAEIGEMIRYDLSQVGVDVLVRRLDFNTLIADVTSPERKFDGVMMAWENDFRLVLHDMFHSRAIDNPFQFASYRNPEVDSLLDVVEST